MWAAMSAESTALLSIVVPVYREERNVPEFLSRMAPILAETGLEHEIIFAMDPSPDRTEEVILEARAMDSRVKLLKLSRRFGQPMATLAGMQFSRGDAVVVMDVDLQDPPELIREMVAAWKSGSEVVFAQRRSREGETMLKRFTAWLGYAVIARFAEVQIPPNTGDFRLMSRRVVDEVVRLRETHGFLRGMVALAGFKQTAVLFDRPARFSGEGNYNRFLGSLRIGFNGVFCFSTAALRLATIAGFASIGASVLIALDSPRTWLMCVVLFLGGVQLLAVGILGEYIGRIYDEVKQRPKFIVDRAEGIDIPKQTRHF